MEEAERRKDRAQDEHDGAHLPQDVGDRLRAIFIRDDRNAERHQDQRDDKIFEGAFHSRKGSPARGGVLPGELSPTHPPHPHCSVKVVSS